MLSRTLLVLTAVVVVAGCEQSTAPSQLKQAPTTASLSATVQKYNQSFPVSGWFYNQCNGDIVSLAGSEHFDETVVSQPGSLSAQLHVNFQGVQGNDITTGAQYNLNAAENVQLRETSTTFSEQFVLNEELVGQGSAPNLDVKITQDVSFDGSNFTFSQPRFSITCH